MKAIRIHQRGGPEAMVLEEVETPQPGAGEVLIKVAAAGVNYADVGQRNGHYPNLRELPTILGDEAAGTIVARGDNVTSLPEGTRVVSLVNGGYAEYAIADARQVVPIPDGVSFAQATVIPIQGQTAYLLLHKAARLQKSESVLIHTASGGVGTLAVQLAKLFGASMVIGTSHTQEKLDFMRSLGVDVAINTQNNPDWIEQVMQATRGQGVNVVLDAIGGEIGQKSIFCLAPFGRTLVFGTLSNDVTQLVAQMLIQKCLTVTGYNTLVQPIEDKMRSSQAVMQYIAGGQLKVILEHTFPFAEVAIAHKAVEANQTLGKVVLTV